MIVSTEFPDVFLQFEHRRYRIRVCEYPLVHKKYGEKWLLNLSYERPSTEGEREHYKCGPTYWQTIVEDPEMFGPLSGQAYAHIPFFFRKKFFQQTLAEQYDYVKAAAEKDNEKYEVELRKEADRFDGRRAAFSSLINEIGLEERN